MALIQSDCSILKRELVDVYSKHLNMHVLLGFCLDTMPMGGSQPTYAFVSFTKNQYLGWNHDGPLDGQEG